MTDIKDVKPDTSLYPYNSPDFYRALALIAEGKRQIECRSRLNKPDNWGGTLVISDLEEYDHRLKPEPRVVWVNFYGGHPRVAYCYDSEETAKAEASIRTFATAVRVELPE